jgi:hypothetical protein
MIIALCLKLYQCTKEYQIVPEITAGTDDSKQHSVVPVCAAVSLTAANVICTVLSAIMSRSIANFTAVYSTQYHFEPQYR